MSPDNPLKIFLIYSHGDDVLLEELRKHLSILERSKNVEIWYEGRIAAGQDWEIAQHDAFEAARIILPLVSSDFIASDDCYKRLEVAIDADRSGKVHTIPVIMRDCAWQDTPMSHLPILPGRHRAVVDGDWETSDEPYRLITETLGDLIDQLRTGQEKVVITIKAPSSEHNYTTAQLSIISDDLPASLFDIVKKYWWAFALGLVAIILLLFIAFRPKHQEKLIEDSKPKLAANEFLDARDQNIYHFAKIGDFVWMTDNLNYNIEGSMAYDKKPSNTERFGRLYTWDAASRACPKGWHLAKESEWHNLAEVYGGTIDVQTMKGGDKAYKALIKGGNSGFNAVKGGLFDPDHNGFKLIDQYGYYWSAREDNSSLAFCYYFNDRGILIWATENRENAYSCRCVKDSE